MKNGEVVGVAVREKHVAATVVDEENREHVIRICLCPASKIIAIGDYIWTQSQTAMWSSKSLGTKDVVIPCHRTLWNDTHPCCDGKR